MGTPAQPDQRPEILPVGQATPQTNVSSASATATFAQMTQIAAYIPSSAWSTEAVLDLHAKQKEVAIRNLDSLDAYRGMESRKAWAGILLIAGIIGFGCYLILIGNSLGKDIIGATILFLAGFLAGRGQANVR